MKKKKIRKWAIRFIVTGLFITGILLMIVLNPIITYANKTTYQQYTIFHNRPLNPVLHILLDSATALVKASEYYNPGLQLDICLNDGSRYPALMEKLRGRAFGWGFYNKVVLMGRASYEGNYVELNGYRWNLIQLLAHEMTHCFQFDKRGFRKSNPIANIPQWKWEGYPEYVARQGADQQDLRGNIARLIEAERADNNGWIQFEDSTGTVIPYYSSWLLVQYCMNIRKMTYDHLIADTTGEQTIREQMMNWYKQQ